MSDSPPRDPELDPELERFLAEARLEEEGAEPELDLDALLGEVEGDIGRAERSPTFWLRALPTWTRRAVAFGAAALVFVVGGVSLLREDFDAYPLWRMVLASGALAALLGVAIHQALRPLHQPPLSGPARFGVVALTLLATCVLAALPAPHGAVGGHEGLIVAALPCVMYGLLMGLPVYLVLRLLDRGRLGATTLLAACGAGLLGNLVLQVHCPNNDPAHLLLGHFGTVALFVAGVGSIHLATRALR